MRVEPRKETRADILTSNVAVIAQEGRRKGRERTVRK